MSSMYNPVEITVGTRFTLTSEGLKHLTAYFDKHEIDPSSFASGEFEILELTESKGATDPVAEDLYVDTIGAVRIKRLSDLTEFDVSQSDDYWAFITDLSPEYFNKVRS